jgi:hypothetical protein
MILTFAEFDYSMSSVKSQVEDIRTLIIENMTNILDGLSGSTMTSEFEIIQKEVFDLE